MNARKTHTTATKHFPSVRIRRQEASHACALLDISEMQLRERVLVDKMCYRRICIIGCILHCYLDIDECAMMTHNCDEALADCSNTPNGSFTCTCIAGYTGNGTTGTCVGE